MCKRRCSKNTLTKTKFAFIKSSKTKIFHIAICRNLQHKIKLNKNKSCLRQITVAIICGMRVECTSTYFMFQTLINGVSDKQYF